MCKLTAHNVTFSKNTSAKLVGGRTRLEKMIAVGKIRMSVTTPDKPHSRWACNAADVISNIKLS